MQYGPRARNLDRIDAIAASLLSPPGATVNLRLWKEVLSDQADADGAGGPLVDLAGRLGIPADERDARVDAARQRAVHALERARRADLAAVILTDAAYPAWLRQIVDPPGVLWVKGALPPPHATSLAIVGSRAGSPAAIELARQLGAGLAAAGVTIVSGLARGVDGASHEGALAGGGSTTAVLGCGADIVYPPEHKALYARVARAGGVISEFEPGTRPLPHHFPLRNRIISGLSRAVVVIEAGEKSGSLITARMALDQGRDVLAVPGNVLSGRSRGCHALLKDGARLVETVGDVLDELGFVRSDESTPKSSDKTSADSDLAVQMAVGETYDADSLASRTGWTTGRLLAELAALELGGVVRRVPGGWVRLSGREC